MIHERVRLIGLALVVFIFVPWLVMRQIDQAQLARKSEQGKVKIVHYLGVPEVATTLNQQIDMAIYRRFLDKPENRDVRIESFSGLEIKDLPASWDAMAQMAFAADRAPDVMQLVTENIQTHREERFVRPLPDRFVFTYSNAAYDDDGGYTRSAVERFRAARRAAEERFAARQRQAEADNLPDEQWLTQAAFESDSAMMDEIRGMAAQMLPDAQPRLAELLDFWNQSKIRNPKSEMEAWHRWLFEKLQARIPPDLLDSLFDLPTGKLYGVDEGEPGLIGLAYRVKPFRQAGLVDAAGRPLLPQTWDELEYWAIAISLLGEGLSSEGVIGYKLAHGTLMPFPFPLYAYGAGGQLVVRSGGVWTCALDSPGTVRAAGWLGRMAFLKPVKIDYTVTRDGRPTTFPLVVIYDRKSPFGGGGAPGQAPQFFLRGARGAGPAQQVTLRRLVLTDDWRVMDRDRELFRFAGRQDLIDRINTLAARSPGQCTPTRAMDKNDLAVQDQLWTADKLAMNYTSTTTLVVDNPDAEGRTRHPDGPAWDRMIPLEPDGQDDSFRISDFGFRIEKEPGVNSNLESAIRNPKCTLVSPDGATTVTVDRKHVVQRQEWQAWPGGPRFTQPPVPVEGGYLQFPCGLQVPDEPEVRTPRTTYRIQVAVINMGMLALNHRLNEDSPDDRRRLDAATRLVAFLAGDEAGRIRVDSMVRHGLGLTLNPIRLRKFGYDDLADRIPRDYEEAMRRIRRIGRAVPAVPNYRGFQQFLANLADRLVIEGEDPAAACRTVTATANKRFLSEADPQVMVRRRKIAWAVFAVVLAGLVLSALWMGRQLVGGLSAHGGATDPAQIGSVGQRPTWRTHLAAWLFLAPAVLTIFIWSYVPLGWGSIMAFQDFHIVRPTQNVWLDNFIRIFSDPEFYKVLANTFYYVLLSLGLGFLAPIVLALMLNEIPWGKIFFRTVFYLPAITSGLVILFMWKQFYQPDNLGLLNTLLTGLNRLPVWQAFLLKLLGVAAVPALALALYNLPLRDDIQTVRGRALAALLPVGLTVWLGYNTPGHAFWTGALGFSTTASALVAGAGAACLVATGLVLLRSAFRSEREFAARRLPWAAPGIALIFLAGWLLRLAVSADADPQSAVSHMGELFALALPLLGLWPILRRLAGREHVPRESMYLVLRQATPATVSIRNPQSAIRDRTPRSACLFAGMFILVLSAVSLAAESSALRMAFKYLLAAGTGWLFHPFLFEPLKWLKDANWAMMCIILPGVWAHMGPGCLIYLAGLKGISQEVYEAADLDGAGAFGKVWHITVPHLLALIIINFVGAFIGAFQASQNILVMTAGGPADATMVLGLRIWLDAFVLLKFGYATAMAWILAVMLIGFTMYKIGILKKVQFRAAGMA